MNHLPRRTTWRPTVPNVDLFFYGGWRVSVSHGGEILDEVYGGPRWRAIELAAAAQRKYRGSLGRNDFDPVERIMLTAIGGRL